MVPMPKWVTRHSQAPRRGVAPNKAAAARSMAGILHNDFIFRPVTRTGPASSAGPALQMILSTVRGRKGAPSPPLRGVLCCFSDEKMAEFSTAGAENSPAEAAMGPHTDFNGLADR